MSKKVWIIFASVCVLLLGGLVYMSILNRVDVSKVDVNVVQPASEESGGIADRVFGNSESPVVLIEYGDFQCPGCSSAHPNIKKLTEKYENQMAFVFRNFPLGNIHPNARAASAAAEAAGLQDKYWEMYNKLFENQSAWESLGGNERTDFFAGYAQELGLNVDKFKEDMAGKQVNQKISFDQAVGKKAKVDSTPSIFLNGKTIEQEVWQDEAKLEDAFVNALKENDVALPEDE